MGVLLSDDFHFVEREHGVRFLTPMIGVDGCDLTSRLGVCVGGGGGMQDVEFDCTRL